MDIKQIDYSTAIDFLLPRHYSGRKPQVKFAFGLFVDEELQAVITYGKPASHALCIGIAGKENAPHVVELNRLCRVDECKVPLSTFVSKTLKMLKPHNLIIVSYADTAMGHVGKIYQACNFLYTGCTKQRTDKYVPDGKHSRHYDKTAEEKFRVVRSAKHRYVYFTGSKKARKNYKSMLKYPILNYPKGNSKTYELGDYIKPNIIEVK